MREFVIQRGLLSLWGGAAALGALAVGALLRQKTRSKMIRTQGSL